MKVIHVEGCDPMISVTEEEFRAYARAAIGMIDHAEDNLNQLLGHPGGLREKVARGMATAALGSDGTWGGFLAYADAAIVIVEAETFYRAARIVEKCNDRNVQNGHRSSDDLERIATEFRALATHKVDGAVAEVGE